MPLTNELLGIKRVLEILLHYGARKNKFELREYMKIPLRGSKLGDNSQLVVAVTMA